MRFAQVIAPALLGLAVVCAGCAGGDGAGGSDEAGTGGSAIAPGSALLGGEGVCQPTCPRSCAVDNDCDTEVGELCCDYGTGKACQAAAQCPRLCADDAPCDTEIGQACQATSIGPGAQSQCVATGSGLRLCQSDGDCRGPGQVCCTNYDRPFCTDASECPSPCVHDSDCDTFDGEICCDTVQAIEPSLKVASLCINAAARSCPKVCTTSSQCAGTSEPLCCDGFCAATCAKTCSQDSECFGQICCKSPRLSLPQPPVLFAEAPQCAGEPGDNCAACLDEFGTCGCPGCAPDVDAGTCLGVGPVSTCAECMQEFQCSPGYCPDCLIEASARCTGTGSNYNCGGCPDGPCAGPCAACQAADAGCLVAFVPCSLNTIPSQCVQESGCVWQPASCAGTVQPCAGITSAATCGGHPGCEWISGGFGTCLGTPTPCGSLSTIPDDAGNSPCRAQPGCFVPHSAGGSTDSGVERVAEGGVGDE